MPLPLARSRRLECLRLRALGDEVRAVNEWSSARDVEDLDSTLYALQVH
ncbi:hypothetical protein [Streptomyces caelestis]